MILHNRPMDPWTRIETELKRRNKDWKWLGAEIGFKPARMGNWRERGIPASAYVAIADALDKSVDWMLGREGVESAKPAIPTTLEQITEALAGYLALMDDDARDDAGDLLRKLALKPEGHARTAAMLQTAFQSGKRKAA